jgi:hypothetical protein
MFAGMGLQPDKLNSIPFYWTVLPNPAPEYYTAQVDSFYAIRKGAGVAELVKIDWAATVSSVMSGDDYGGEKMLDGDPATYWYANGPTTAWVSWAEIDMQTVKMITSIRIDCDFRIKNAALYAVEDNTEGYGTAIATISKSNTGRFDWDIELSSPIFARYLRLTLNDSYWYGYHIIYDIYVKGYSK